MVTVDYEWMPMVERAIDLFSIGDVRVVVIQVSMFMLDLTGVICRPYAHGRHHRCSSHGR